MAGGKNRPLVAGATVQVRQWLQIAATLDQNGSLDGLPFMPEMRSFCGQSFVVSKRLERTCEEVQGDMRRIRNVVFLDNLRCDGSAHGGCQKGCLIFWKEAWLQREATVALNSWRNDGGNTMKSPQSKLADGRYICQSTELRCATSQLSILDFGMYLRDLRARTYSTRELSFNLLYALYLRLRQLWTGKSYRVMEGPRDRTPVEVLALQPGEWVQVKTPREIEETLDRNGKNQGLAFTVEMESFCGRKFRVLRRLDKMIQERTQKLVEVNHTVILDGVTCDGRHILRGGCPRNNYHFWREIWLRRTSAPPR
jgi:hypothetical protein